MGMLDIVTLSNEEVLSGLDELIAGVKKDEYLNKQFYEILEDSKRRIKSCVWRDYVTDKPTENVKAVFKYIDYELGDNFSIENFNDEDENIKRNCEDGWTCKEDECLWKPVETEYKVDFKKVWSGLFELKKGMDEDDFLRSKYSNLIRNIMERVNSGEWKNLRGYPPAIRTMVIYKAYVTDNYTEYGVAMYFPNKKYLASSGLQKFSETTLWKPLEIEEMV